MTHNITFNSKILLIPDTQFLATLMWLNGLMRN